MNNLSILSAMSNVEITKISEELVSLDKQLNDCERIELHNVEEKYSERENI